MWCGHCQADVAAEVSPDNQRVLCALCGMMLNTIAAPPSQLAMGKLGERTRDARELLQRWSSSKLIDPFGPSVSAVSANSMAEQTSAQPGKPTDSAASVSLESAAKIRSEFESTAQLPNSPPAVHEEKPDRLASQSVTSPAFEGLSGQLDESSDLRLPPLRNPLAEINDQSRPAVAPSSSPFVISDNPPLAITLPLPATPSVALPVRNQLRIDAAHPAVHFASRSNARIEPSSESAGRFAARGSADETQRSSHWIPSWDSAAWRTGPNVSGSWSSVAGQFLAYAGVLGLSAGACMVVWSYFGGPANYAPTGWLLATAGQMLLFFGVVSLVSGGLEQTTEQVNHRIEQLGDHIIRIEQAAREMSLRGSPVPPGHFSNDPDTALQAHSAGSGDESSVVKL